MLLALLAAATIDSITPPQGPIAGGTIVTIRGSGFAGANVKLDRDPIAPLSQSDAEVRLQTPTHDSGSVVVRVGDAPAEFLYVPPKLDELPPGFITTVAGIGQYARDFGAATQASLTHPEGLDFDRAGNLYIADTNIGIIYRVHHDGTIERFAGGGLGPQPHDGGPAIDGLVVFPRDVAIDGNDNLYIPDVFQCRIRKVDAQSGIITTIAGTGVCGAPFGQPTYLTADADDLFFIDFPANAVRRLHLADNTLSTFVSGGCNPPVHAQGASPPGAEGGATV